jgi:hypothetical protein
MRLLHFVTPTAFLSLGLSQEAKADNGCAGIYTVPQGLAFSGKELSVIANMACPTALGIVGAECRIEVDNPTGWFISFAPSPGATGVSVRQRGS